MRWERVKLKFRTESRLSGRKGGTAGPGKRWGHTCNSVKNGRALYVFGGYGKDNRQTNDVHVFDTVKQTWKKPVVQGTVPSPRDSHSCTTVGSNLFVFGGTDGRTPLQDLYILDTNTNTWSKPQLEGDGPAPREGHSAALIGDIIYIFGGCGKTPDESEEIYFNDLYMLDTAKMTWTKAVTKGKPPTPRDSHTCSSWNKKLMILGGEDASDSYLADVHILDTELMEWKELNTTGQLLMPRAGHTTVAVGKHVLVFGGFTDDRKLYDDLHMLTLDTGVWTKITTTGLGPSARFSVAGDCVDMKSGILVFIGGCNENLEALDDMYYLDTELQSDKGLDEKPEKNAARKELKRKRQENQSIIKSPEAEKDTIGNLKSRKIFNASTAPPPAVGLYELKPVDEKIFEAKITDVFHYGYTIETIIDGKPLRGLLFSYKPGFAHAVHAYLTRKKLSSDGHSTQTKDSRKAKLKVARAVKNTVSTPDAQSMPSENNINVEETLTPRQFIPDQQAQYMPSSHHVAHTQSQYQIHGQPQPQMQAPSQPPPPPLQPQPPPHQYPLQHQQFMHWQQQHQQQQHQQQQHQQQHHQQQQHQQQHHQQQHHQQQHHQPNIHYSHQQQLLSPPNHYQQRASLNVSQSVLQQDPRYYMGSGYPGPALHPDGAPHHQSSGQTGMYPPPHALSPSIQGMQPSREPTDQK